MCKPHKYDIYTTQIWGSGDLKQVIWKKKSAKHLRGWQICQSFKAFQSGSITAAVWQTGSLEKAVISLTDLILGFGHSKINDL